VGQLVAIVLVVILLCAAGVAMQQGNAVQRALGHLLLGAGGLVTGLMLALLLGFWLWPGALAVLFGGTYQPLPPDQDRWASILFFAILGGCGAIVPSLAFRLGYAAGALAVVGQSLDYWTRRDLGWVILVGIATWVIVAVVVRTVAWWLRPDPQ
jgi:hypothetical protein